MEWDEEHYSYLVGDSLLVSTISPVMLSSFCFFSSCSFTAACALVIHAMSTSKRALVTSQV